MVDLKFFPVTTLDDLETVDAREMRDGYWAGYRGDPEPGHNYGRSYWHGWRNGALDGGHIEKDSAHAKLAHEVCTKGIGRLSLKHKETEDE